MIKKMILKKLNNNFKYLKLINKCKYGHSDPLIFKKLKYENLPPSAPREYKVERTKNVQCKR